MFWFLIPYANFATLITSHGLAVAKLNVCSPLQYIGYNTTSGLANTIKLLFTHILLKDAAMGYVSVQTVCSVLRADLYRAWT